MTFQFFDYLEPQIKKSEKGTKKGEKPQLSKGVGSPFATGAPGDANSGLVENPQIGDLQKHVVGTVEVSLLPFLTEPGLQSIDTGRVNIIQPKPENLSNDNKTGKELDKKVRATDANQKGKDAQQSIQEKEEETPPPTTHIRVEISKAISDLVDLREWNVLSVAVGGLCGLPRIWEEKAKYEIEPMQRLYANNILKVKKKKNNCNYLNAQSNSLIYL